MSAYSRTLANFVQPATNGFVTVTVDSSTDWMAAGQAVYCTNGGYYTAYNIPSAATVILLNLGYTGNVAAGAVIPTGSKISPAGIRGAAGTDTTVNKVYDGSATDPTGVVSVAGPAIYISTTDQSLWHKPTGTTGSTGWVQIV